MRRFDPQDSRTKSEGYHAYDSIALLELAAACRASYGSKFPGGDRDYLYRYKTKSRGLGLLDVVRWILPCVIPSTHIVLT